MSRYYDRLGVPINLWEWAALMEDRDYQRIAWDLVNDRWYVSTVWLGLDHSFASVLPGLREDHVPVIFETMVFDQRSQEPYRDLEMRRYASEGAAREGHAMMVALVEALEGVETP